MRRWLLALACLTLGDVNNAVCQALCRQDGYDMGAYVKAKCRCSNEVEYEVATEKALFITRKRDKLAKPPSPVTNIYVND